MPVYLMDGRAENYRNEVPGVSQEDRRVGPWDPLGLADLAGWWVRVLIPDLAMIQEAYDLLNGQREAPGS